MIEFVMWLITLPFQLLGLVLSIVFGLVGAVLSVIGAIVGSILGLGWALFCIGVVVLLVMGLIKLVDRHPATAR
jgi:hypothetical protein